MNAMSSLELEHAMSRMHGLASICVTIGPETDADLEAEIRLESAEQENDREGADGDVGQNACREQPSEHLMTLTPV